MNSFTLDDVNYTNYYSLLNADEESVFIGNDYNKIGESLGKKISDYEYNLFEYFEETYMKTILIAN